MRTESRADPVAVSDGAIQLPTLRHAPGGAAYRSRTIGARILDLEMHKVRPYPSGYGPFGSSRLKLLNIGQPAMSSGKGRFAAGFCSFMWAGLIPYSPHGEEPKHPKKARQPPKIEDAKFQGVEA